MPKPNDPRPCREFPREGYALYLEPDGVEVHVTDYHAKPLKLGWDVLEQMRRDAQARSSGDAAEA